MAKPAPRTVLVPTPAVAAAFNAAAGRLGLGWVAVTESAAPDRVADLSADDPAVAANGIIAQLLGGTAAAPPEPPPPPPPPKKQLTAKLSRETAGRRGKGVTVVSELGLTDAELRSLATTLKGKCGTGGTAKDGRIEIQGDHRDRLATELEKLGYKVNRSGG
jgi:predicted translation initiation factor SUI1